MPGRPKRLCYDQSTANLTEEEQAIRAENLKARQRLNDDGVRRLASAVCLSAVKEYRRCKKALAFYAGDIQAMKDKSHRVPQKNKDRITALQTSMKECEAFFGSNMFAECTGLENPLDAIRKIDRIPRSYDILLAKERR